MTSWKCCSSHCVFEFRHSDSFVSFCNAQTFKPHCIIGRLPQMYLSFSCSVKNDYVAYFRLPEIILGTCKARSSLKWVCGGMHPQRLKGLGITPGQYYIQCMQGYGPKPGLGKRSNSWATTPTMYLKKTFKKVFLSGRRANSAKKVDFESLWRALGVS